MRLHINGGDEFLMERRYRFGYSQLFGLSAIRRRASLRM